jgi:cobalt-zinc-cadmium efflux system outer membrane protein
MQFLSFDGPRPVGVVRVVSGFVTMTMMTLAVAQTAPGGGEVSVEGVVAGVIAANPELKAYDAALAAAREESRVAGRLAHPTVGVEAGQIRSYNLDRSLAGEGAVWTATIQQTFEWPGRMSLRKAIANQDVELATIGLGRFRQALGGRARELALGLAGATEKARVAREVADRFRALRDVLVQRDPAGVTPQLEIRILEATELGLRRRASDRELEAGERRIELNLLLGRASDAPAEFSWEAPRFEALPTNMDLLASALTNNFELRSRMTEVAQQGFRVALAKNERWPAITVAPAYAHENGSNLDRTFTVGVQVPLPLWKNTTANVAAAEARRVQAESLLAASRREVERQVVVAAQRFSVRSDEMVRWRDDSVKAFRDAAELADRHYRLGAVPATTYVELQKQYLEAVEALLDTRRDALESALALEQLTGFRLVGVAANVEGGRP